MTTDAEIVAPIAGNQAAATGMIVGAALWPIIDREVKLATSGTDDASIAQGQSWYYLYDIGQPLVETSRTFEYLTTPTNTLNLQDAYAVGATPETLVLRSALFASMRIVPLIGDIMHSLIEGSTPPLPELHTQRKYVRTALEAFKNLNADEPAIIETLACAVRILNLSIDRGYRPVATIDDDDNSIEIEARLDPNRLLLVQLSGSGEVDGLIYNNTGEFESIETRSASGTLAWLIASENQEDLG